jgi:hypothetical protein
LKRPFIIAGAATRAVAPYALRPSPGDGSQAVSLRSMPRHTSPSTRRNRLSSFASCS